MADSNGPGAELVERSPMQVVLTDLRSGSFVDQVRQALPGNVLPERFVRAAVTAIQQTPELITCDRASLYRSVIRCAQDGLLPDGREAALVIFDSKKDGKQAQYLPMIGGYRKIAAKHGYVLVADVVRQGDEFEWSRIPPHLKHTPALGALGEVRGEILYAYAVAFDRDWRFVTAPQVMDVPEIERVRAVSRAGKSEYGPWAKWWDRMACKTVARRLFNELPLGDLDEVAVRIRDAADVDSDLSPVSDGGMTVEEAELSVAVSAQIGGAGMPDDGGPDDTGKPAAAEVIEDAEVTPIVPDAGRPDGEPQLSFAERAEQAKSRRMETGQ